MLKWIVEKKGIDLLWFALCTAVIHRVLSGIYRLGEKFRVAEGNNIPRRVQGQAALEIFRNEYTLRCNLVHFGTQFWEMLQCLQGPCRVWMIFPIYLPIYCNDNIFLRGKLGAFFFRRGGELLPLKYPLRETRLSEDFKIFKMRFDSRWNG